MTNQEQQLLDGLIERVQQTRPTGKDGQAEQRLQQALGNDPDAVYVLAQTVLVQQYALEQAQKQLADARQQITDLQQRIPAPEQHTSFLGSLFGSSHSAPAPPPPQLQSVPQYAPVNYALPAYGQPTYAAQPQSGMFGGSGFGGGGGFLQGALQTAAGVAAGEMAFRGIEDLMHGFGHSAGYGSDRMMGGSFDQPEVVNNYYGDSERGREHDSFGDRLHAADGGDGRSADVEDRRGFLDSSSGDDDLSPQSDGNTDQFAGSGSDDFSADDSSSDFGSSDDNS